MAANHLAFIVTDRDTRIQPSQRQLIRRHCMQGKNKKPGSRRSKREARRAGAASNTVSVESATTSWSFVDRISADGGVTWSHTEEKRPRRQNQLLICQQSCVKVWNDDSTAFPPSLPSDWALFPFAVKLDARSRSLLHKYFRQNPIRDPLLPFHYFGIQINIGIDPQWCRRLLESEELMLAVVVLLASASDDLVIHGSLSNSTRRYLKRVLRLLNNRLSSPGEYKHEMVLYVVAALASTAIAFGDYTSAEAHAVGLSNILHLRGGLDSITRNPAMQLAIDRLNFSSMLMTDRWHTIYGGGTWIAPCWSDEVTTLYKQERMLPGDFISDKALAEAFHTLQHTALLLNLHTSRGTAVDGMLFRYAMGYSQTNLASRAQQGNSTDKVAECVRQAMTVFIAATFRLPGLYEHPCLPRLTGALGSCIAESWELIEALPDALQIWLLLMGSMTTQKVDEVVRPSVSWKEAALNHPMWADVRRQARRVMWFDAVHDDLGRSACERLRGHVQDSRTTMPSAAQDLTDLW